MSRSIHAAQGESSPYNHHLHQFPNFLKHERGFEDRCPLPVCRKNFSTIREA
jgi:hypothetical protein